MLEACGPGDRPRAGKGFGVTKIWPELHGAVGGFMVEFGGEVGVDLGQQADVGDAPGLRSICEIAI